MKLTASLSGRFKPTWNPFAPQVSRAHRFPDTKFYKLGETIVWVKSLWSGFVTLGFILHAYLLIRAGMLIFQHWHDWRYAIGLPFLYWALDVWVVMKLAPDPLKIFWRRISLIILLEWFLTFMLGHELRVRFTKENILIQKCAFHIPYWILKVKRKDVEHPAGGASAYGFYLSQISARELEHYRWFLEILRRAPLIAYLCMLFFGRPLNPDDRPQFMVPAGCRGIGIISQPSYHCWDS